ncbi:MAG: pseudouridine synthase [Thermodesulfobacteriota bacterium]
MTNDFIFLTGDADSGERLDRILAERTGLSLRAARRMIGRNAVSVEGRTRAEAYKLRPGQIVKVAGEGENSPAGTAPGASGLAMPEEGGPRLLKAGGGFLAFFKPAGLHTAALAGGGGPSLEAMLPGLHPGEVILVNRLDRETSGIVLGALSREDAERFREMENRGEVDKRYLAVVWGAVDAPVELRWRLDTAGRARTRVLDAPAADRLRWTRVNPVGMFDGRTLIEARIAKGARHQIRAHLARAGRPIAGDELYGTPEEGGLRLHHWRCSLPGFCAACAPDWNEVKVLVEFFSEEHPCEE